MLRSMSSDQESRQPPGVAPAREYDVETAYGRILHVHEAGDPGGVPVIVHHGTPSAGVLPTSWHLAARADGVRLVGVDRPGYGGSDRHPGRTVADVVPDTVAVADALGIGRFRTFGVSGGGPHVLACAALLPDRVIAAACMSGVAPYDARDLDFLAGMGQDNLDEFGAAVAGEPALAEYLTQQRETMLATTPADLVSAMESLLPPVDRDALTSGFAEFMHASFADGLRGGIDGWLDDDVAFTRPWGFDVADVAVPTQVIAGRADLFVPFAHATWLAAHVHGAETALSPADGHLSLFAKYGEAQRWLLGQG